MYGCPRTTRRPAGSRHQPGRPGRALAAVALAAAFAAGATACSGGGPQAARLNPTAVAGPAGSPASAGPASFSITPASGTKDASPAGGITVTAVSGAKVSGVTVKASGDSTVTGTLSADGTSWHSSYALPTGQSYTVTATGTGPTGRPATAKSTFTTLRPATAFHTEIFEGAGLTYGVGMPIMLTFDHPITD